MINGKLGNVGNRGIFFPSFRFWVLDQNRKVEREKVRKKISNVSDVSEFSIWPFSSNYFNFIGAWLFVLSSITTLTIEKSKQFQRFLCFFSRNFVLFNRLRFRIRFLNTIAWNNTFKYKTPSANREILSIEGRSTRYFYQNGAPR